MKTLLFAPCFLDEGERLQRNLKWLEYYTNLKGTLHYDEILLVDNASSPDKKKILKEQFPQVTLIECSKHLGRPKANQYGYWYAAFAKAAKYAIDNNFDKIVHIDSDVFVFTNAIVNHINNFNYGWLAYWCEMYNYPESTFQLIAKDQFQNMYEHMTRDFLAYYPDGMAETNIPFTHIEKSFVGDRHGEKGILAQDPLWDYCGQVLVEMKVSFNV